jgi:hypothetical protein
MRLAIGLRAGSTLVGVATVGRPVARHLDDGATAEVTRVATDGTRNANSMLYAACWRAARAMGYERLVTYTQAGETGASLHAAGFVATAHLPPHRGWDRPARRRTSDTGGADRTRWEIATSAARADAEQPTRTSATDNPRPTRQHPALQPGDRADSRSPADRPSVPFRDRRYGCPTDRRPREGVR